MRTGSLRHPITVERQATTRDETGQYPQTWSTLCSRVASVEPLNGREYFNASGERSEVSTRIRMHYDSVTATIKPFDRVLHGSTTYDILSVIDPRERHHEVILMCRRAG
jgi:SPP1 family predicted phage head-tail adaptor